MPIEKLKPTFSLEAERIKQLEQVLPEAFADGKLNWDVLRDLLGDVAEEEGRDAEHFGLFWHGKRETRRLASMPSKGTLVIKFQVCDAAWQTWLWSDRCRCANHRQHRRRADVQDARDVTDARAVQRHRDD